nr:hypothetical protein [Leptospira interrogans]
MGNVRRGDVGFSKGCPESWLTSPTYIYISMFNMSEMAFSPNCSMQEVLIDSTTGFFMTGFDDYITKPDQFYNPPVASAFVDGNPLTFQLPAIANRLAETDAYVLVVPFDSSKGAGRMLFEVSIDNVLFWDANDVYSPQLSPGDRPNATSGDDNLTNSTRKNLIFHVPTIVGSLK